MAVKENFTSYVGELRASVITGRSGGGISDQSLTASYHYYVPNAVEESIAMIKESKGICIHDLLDHQLKSDITFPVVDGELMLVEPITTTGALSSALYVYYQAKGLSGKELIKTVQECMAPTTRYLKAQRN